MVITYQHSFTIFSLFGKLHKSLELLFRTLNKMLNNSSFVICPSRLEEYHCCLGRYLRTLTDNFRPQRVHQRFSSRQFLYLVTPTIKSTSQLFGSIVLVQLNILQDTKTLLKCLVSLDFFYLSREIFCPLVLNLIF